MNNFSFGHNVVKTRLLQMRQNASKCGEGLNNIPDKYLVHSSNKSTRLVYYVYKWVHLLRFLTRADGIVRVNEPVSWLIYNNVSLYNSIEFKSHQNTALFVYWIKDTLYTIVKRL